MFDMKLMCKHRTIDKPTEDYQKTQNSLVRWFELLYSNHKLSIKNISIDNLWKDLYRGKNYVQPSDYWCRTDMQS